MRRIRLTVEYDGTDYSGWQRQDNAMTVQEKLERALARLTGAPVTVTGASRTDAGVHALGQVAHFDTLSRIPGEKFSFALNTMLPPDIRVRASTDAPPGFHARFDARGKIYRYQIFASPHDSALLRRTHAHSIYPLDARAMDAEARALIGVHDFRAFAASGSVARDTVREIRAARVLARPAEGGEELTLLVYGTGFLYNMVRIAAGTLLQVGGGKLSPGAVTRSLADGSRLSLGVTAPPQGLTLMRVFYDDDIAEAMPLFESWARRCGG